MPKGLCGVASGYGRLTGRFRRQHPMSSYIVDFACLERKLIVEADGGQHTAQLNDDTERTVWLQSRE